MQMQVSRSNNLKIPKKINIVTKSANDTDDTIAIKKAIAIAENKKFNEEKMKEKIELDDKDLKVIEKVNFRKSFLEEYSTLFTEGIVDKEVTISYEDTTKVVSLSSPKNEKEIEDYIHKLQNYYQVEYFKIDVIREEEGTFYLEYSPNKKQEIIKLIPIKDEKGFKPNLGYGVIAVS